MWLIVSATCWFWLFLFQQAVYNPEKIPCEKNIYISMYIQCGFNSICRHLKTKLKLNSVFGVLIDVVSK